MALPHEAILGHSWWGNASTCAEENLIPQIASSGKVTNPLQAQRENLWLLSLGNNQSPMGLVEKPNIKRDSAVSLLNLVCSNISSRADEIKLWKLQKEHCF